MRYRFLCLSFVLWGTLLHAQKADTSSVEWIKVYFNMPGDKSVAWEGNEAEDNRDLMDTFIELADNAQYSIDLCVYDLENPRIGQALVRAKQRGLRVRLVTDNYNRNDSKTLDPPMWEMLRNAGIISIDDDGDVYWQDGTIEDNKLQNSGADMHHKFAVFDMLSKNPDDWYVWTGSTNLTLTCNINTNNTIVIKDSDIAKAYHFEFEQMWGGSGDKPNASKARFHKDKLAYKQHTFWVGDTKVELYFAPINRDRTKPRISERIVQVIEKETDHDLNFSAFSITPTIAISQALWNKSSSGEVILRGVIDRGFYSRYEKAGEIWSSTEARLLNREIQPASELRKLHHKTIIIDATNPDPKDVAITITGSYNFSNNADDNNDENLLIIYNNEIANQYYQDFKGILKRARGEFQPPVPDVKTDSTYKVYRIVDAQKLEMMMVDGFGYGVSLLGVKAPRVYSGPDSSDYYAGIAMDELRNIIGGGKIRVSGPSGAAPQSRYNQFYAYVEAVRADGSVISVNREMIKRGMAEYAPFFAQHPDSVAAYKALEQQARAQKLGMWKTPSKVGTKVKREREVDDPLDMEGVFPININTATKAELTLLPGIGPARADAIIEYREKNNGFKSVDELTKIRGIGVKTLETLRPLVVH